MSKVSVWACATNDDVRASNESVIVLTHRAPKRSQWHHLGPSHRAHYPISYSALERHREENLAGSCVLLETRRAPVAKHR